LSSSVRRLAAAALTSVALVASPCFAQSIPSATPSPLLAQPTASPSPVPSPSPSATPSGPSDPCTSILAVVNRPTVTTGSCVFKNGRGDLEVGYTNTITTGSGGGATVAYPQAFLRAGTFARNVELDVTPPTLLRSSAGGATVTGPSDAAFGLKWEAGYTSKAIASINVIATTPTGDRAFTAGGSSYTGNLNLGYTLNSVFSLSTTLGFESLAAPGTNGSVLRTGVFNPSLLLVAALPGTSQLYGEVSNTSHAGVGLGGRTLYNFGFQKQLGSRIVFDIEGGFAPNPVAGQKLQYLGFGLSYGNV
jgi:hypothetical protein